MNSATTAAIEVTFKPGDRVNWDSTNQGGYGFSLAVAAVVKKIGAKRIQIEVRTRVPYSKALEWESRTKWVAAESLRSRKFPSEAFGEPMEMKVDGLVVKGWKHPAGGAKAFPRGIWYGEVDGMTCTAPCASEEAAVQMAYLAATEGGYRTALLSAIEVREGWIRLNQDKNGEGAAELPDLRRRLQQLNASKPTRDADRPADCGANV